MNGNNPLIYLFEASKSNSRNKYLDLATTPIQRYMSEVNSAPQYGFDFFSLMGIRHQKPRITGKHSCGRRRDSSKHKAILQATRELIEEKGYQGLSLSKIASRANVTRNVLYNWWNGDLNHIVEEALFPNMRECPAPDTGNFQNDVEAFLDIILDAIHKPHVLKGFLNIASEIISGNQELSNAASYFRGPYVHILTTIIKNAEARDEITQGLNPSHISQIVSGAVMQFAISKQAGRRKSKAILSTMIIQLAEK